MDWRRVVTGDANETDLLRSYAVRVTDATFGYEASRPQPRVVFRPRMDAKECGRCSSVALCGSSDPSQMTTALAWSPVTATSGMSRRRRTSRWSNGGVRWQQRPTKPTIKAPRFDVRPSPMRPIALYDVLARNRCHTALRTET